MIFQFNNDQILSILRCLDKGAHGEVRPIIDYIINEGNAQAQAEAAVMQQKQQPQQPEGSAPSPAGAAT